MFVQQFSQWVLALAKFTPYQESHSYTLSNPANSLKHVDHEIAIAEAVKASNSCVSTPVLGFGCNHANLYCNSVKLLQNS